MLCPVVRQAEWKTERKVCVHGRAEMHTEGLYYIEWRDNNRRRPQAVSNCHEVLKQAHLMNSPLEPKPSFSIVCPVRPLRPAVLKNAVML